MRRRRSPRFFPLSMSRPRFWQSLATSRLFVLYAGLRPGVGVVIGRSPVGARREATPSKLGYWQRGSRPRKYCSTSSLRSNGSKSVSMATASGRPNPSKRGFRTCGICAPHSSTPLNLRFRTDAAMTSTSFSDAQKLLSQIESPNFPHTEKAVEADLPSPARRTWA